LLPELFGNSLAPRCAVIKSIRGQLHPRVLLAPKPKQHLCHHWLQSALSQPIIGSPSISPALVIAWTITRRFPLAPRTISFLFSTIFLRLFDQTLPFHKLARIPATFRGMMGVTIGRRPRQRSLRAPIA
jgi:hypothetical protein